MVPKAETFDPDLAWMLCSKVSVRPEPFGALLYHFGNRRLSFLKDRVLLEVVQSLGAHPSATQAIAAALPPGADPDRYVQALAALATSEILVPVETKES